MTYLPLSMLRSVGILLVFHTFLQCLILGLQGAVDNMIEETNATKKFEFKMPAPIRVRDFVLVSGTDKFYIECLNEVKYVTYFFIVDRNTELVPQNQCS